MHDTAHALLPPLLQELERHPVVTNRFFRMVERRGLRKGELQAFIPQYHYFCHQFVKRLEGLLYRTPLERLAMRVELAKTLYSELGDGRPEQAHIRLLERFAQAVGLPSETLVRTVPLAPVTAYLDLLDRLFLTRDYLTALGSELAVEVTAAAEFRVLYPALQKLEGIRKDDLIFFELHLKEEVDHGRWLLTAVAETARTTEEFARVAEGARETADGWLRFWDGLHDEILEREAA